MAAGRILQPEVQAFAPMASKESSSLRSRDTWPFGGFATWLVDIRKKNLMRVIMIQTFKPGPARSELFGSFDWSFLGRKG